MIQGYRGNRRGRDGKSADAFPTPSIFYLYACSELVECSELGHGATTTPNRIKIFSSFVLPRLEPRCARWPRRAAVPKKSRPWRMILYRDSGTVRFFPPSSAAVSAKPFGQ